MSIKSYGQILEELNETEKWFNSFKGDTETTRFKQIIKKVKELNEVDINASKPSKITKNKAGREGQEALTEASSLNAIRKGFEKYGRNKLPIKKLREILEGPFYSTDEIASEANVNPRNTMFELEIASRFILQGFHIKRFEDIEIDYNRLTVCVQCKRLFSESNISYNIGKAYEQLIEKNSVQDNDKRGLIALSVEKIERLDEKILFAKDQEVAEGRLNLEAKMFQEKHISIFDSFLGKKNLWGLLIHMKFDVVIDNISTLGMIEGIFLRILLNPLESNTQKELNNLIPLYTKFMNLPSLSTK